MPRSRHFWTVAAAFMAVMAFSSLPSPLYGLYQQRDGFSAFTVTVIYAAYAVGVIAALLGAGHLSDAHGRRRLLVPAIGASLLSAVVFLVWRDLPGLLLARVLNGLSVGVVAATATAYLADLDTRGTRAQLVGSAANLGGIGLGPVIGGFLAQWAPSPLTLPYVVFLGALGLGLAAVVSAPETREPQRPRPAYRIQKVAGGYAAPFAGAFVAFGTMGLFTGLAGTFMAGTLHRPSHALAGVAVAAVFGGGVAAQVATARWATRHVLALGLAVMPAGLALVVLAAWLPTPSLALFLLGGAAAGAGAGAVFKGTVGTVIAAAAPAARAEALAGLFLAGYLGLSVPVLGAGIALQYVSARDTLLGFAVVATLATIAAAPRLVASPTTGRAGLRRVRPA